MCNKEVAQQRKVDNNILNKVHTKGEVPIFILAVIGRSKAFEVLDEVETFKADPVDVSMLLPRRRNLVRRRTWRCQHTTKKVFFSMVRSGMKAKTHGIQVSFSQIQSYILKFAR